MEIKAILFDADGVTISAKRFSERLRDEYDIPIENFLEFYKAEMQACLTGKADLKLVIPPYIDIWNYPGDANDLVEEWCAYENDPEDEVLDIVEALRNQGTPCYLVTDNEKYRTKYMEDKMGFAEKFDQVFSSCYLGVKKDDPQYFELVLSELDLDAEEVLLVDDKTENVATAKSLGIHTILYKDADQFMSALERHGFEDVEFE